MSQKGSLVRGISAEMQDMILSYLIFDSVTCVYQHKTYINEYMIQESKYQEIEKAELIEQKLGVYKKFKETKSQNKI